VIEWAWLIFAILFEVAGTVSLKAMVTSSSNKWFSGLSILFFYGVSFAFLGASLKKLEVGVAYAIWSGLGTALITLIGIISFEESVSLIKILSIILIIMGVVGLNLQPGIH
jgi:small multidrug resistance pump